MNDSKVQNTSLKVKSQLTQSRLKELLHYYPETGIFRWKINTLNNKSFIGDVAGTKMKIGYICISINRKRYYASRLAFLYMEGYFPEYHVDHINRIRDDNRWKNLRHVSHKCNLRNCSLSKNNTSGITGVSWDKRRNLWESYIKVDFNRKHLGRYTSLIDAVKARWNAEVKYGFPNCNSESSAFLFLQNQK